MAELSKSGKTECKQVQKEWGVNLAISAKGTILDKNRITTVTMWSNFCTKIFPTGLIFLLIIYIFSM